MWFDVDLEDGLDTPSRNSKAQRREAVIEEAIVMVKRSFASAGQVGIYTSEDGAFIGYILKRPGEEPYFDDDQSMCSLDHIFRAYA